LSWFCFAGLNNKMTTHHYKVSYTSWEIDGLVCYLHPMSMSHVNKLLGIFFFLIFCWLFAGSQIFQIISFCI
jgi:hypothetical protein